MMTAVHPKDLIYFVMIIILVVCAIVMFLEKVDICYALLCFMVSLLTGMFYLMFFDAD